MKHGLDVLEVTESADGSGYVSNKGKNNDKKREGGPGGRVMDELSVGCMTAGLGYCYELGWLMG